MVALPPSSTSAFDLQPFRSYLVSQNYSDSTIRNYIADVNRYLRSLPPSFTVSHIFSPDQLKAHLSSLTADSNYRRYLSALNLFCQFALSQQIISQNPLKSVLKDLQTPPQPSLTTLVSLFKNHLISQKTSPVTIHNYINDLNQYIIWLEAAPSPVKTVTPTAPLKHFSFKNLFSRHSET